MMTRLSFHLLGLVLLIAVPALAAVPPTITTNAANNITDTGASLNAIVTPNDLVPTAVVFSYGLGPATVTFYSSYLTASSGSLVVGGLPTLIAVSAVGLACNHQYHFSVVAYYPGGAVQGSELQFTTLACDAIATLAASSITASGGTLNGLAYGATNGSFDYGPTIGYGNNTTNIAGGLAPGSYFANLTGLGCSTLVHYRASGQGTIAPIHGGDQTFSTTPCPGAAAATTGLGSTITATGATLNGLVDDTGAASSASVTFEYGATNAYGNTVAATPALVAAGSGSTAVSVAITGLACNTLYHFRVDATNGAFTTYGVDRAVDTAPCAAAVNDTGVDFCVDNGSLVPCTVANSGDAATYPRQDGRFGRDPAADTGSFTKTGTGDKGFDYTKVCNTAGNIAGQNDCPSNVFTTSEGYVPPNEWSCTRDNVTSLVWASQAGTFNDGPGFTIGSTFADALSRAANLNSQDYCGFSSGWRLPTLKELSSLIHNDRLLPAYDPVYFTYVPNAYLRGTNFWTSDVYSGDPTQVSVISMDDGSGGLDFKAAFPTTNGFWLVHSSSGDVPTPPALTDNGDGTVTDANTGLMWDQCSWGTSGTACTVGSALGQYWLQTLATSVTANAMNGGIGYKGHNDWRVPNKNELISITDPTHSPAIDPVIFPNTVAANYWTSTTYAGTSSVGWTVYFPIGGPATNGFTVAQPFPPFVPPYLRLVRGGRIFDGFDVLHPFRVTYNGNGNTSGSVPVDGTAYGTGDTVTVLGNTGNLQKTSSMFLNWNTHADGSGTTFHPGDTFTFGALNVTLYAQWTPSSVNVSGQVSVTQNGFGRNRATGLWAATLTVTNTSAFTINGPIEVVLTNLSANATMVNKTGLHGADPYIVVTAGSLTGGASASVSIQFSNPTNGYINYTAVTYSGTF
jgi:hypothetical protein